MTLHLLPDRTPGVGAGHLSRCLAVGAAWVRRGGTATAPADLPDPWAERYRAAGIEVGIEPGQGPTADWVLVDDYHADRQVQTRLRAEHRVALLDDDGILAPYDADVVIDPNRDGGRFALLRPEVVAGRGPRQIGVARRVLMSFGAEPTAEVRTVLDAVADRLAAAGYEIDRLVGVADVVPHLRGADVAVAASGTTAFELACLGTPAVLVPVADNQVPVTRGLTERGAARTAALDADALTTAALDLAADVDARRAMSAAAMAAVDGRGAERAVAEILAADLELSPVTAADAAVLLRWANDPATRAASHSPDPITWDDHVAWLGRRLAADTTTPMWVARRNGTPVGVVRFDPVAPDDPAGSGELAYTVAPEARGRGLGAALVLAGTRAWGRPARAEVYAANRASIGALEMAGYVHHETRATDGRGDLLVYRKDRP